MPSDILRMIYEWGSTKGSQQLNKACLPLPAFMRFCESIEAELDLDAADHNFNGFMSALIKRADSSRRTF